MKIILRLLLALLLASPVLPATAAAQTGTRASADDAVAMVKQAVAYLKKHGREQSLAEFNRPQGPFRDRDLYLIVFDLNGIGLAHHNPRLLGKPTGDIMDADGKHIFHEQRRIGVERGAGWVDYKWPNPVSGRMENKSTYVEKAGDLLVMCGIYK